MKVRAGWVDQATRLWSGEAPSITSVQIEGLFQPVTGSTQIKLL